MNCEVNGRKCQTAPRQQIGSPVNGKRNETQKPEGIVRHGAVEQNDGTEDEGDLLHQIVRIRNHEGRREEHDTSQVVDDGMGTDRNVWHTNIIASKACSGRAIPSAAVLNTFRVFRIILTNAVKYVTNVESYDRRIQSAINIQGKKMQRRAEFLLTRALRQAGWK